MRTALAVVAVTAIGAWFIVPSPERTVTVDIQHSAFRPGHLEFEQGETVRLVVKNHVRSITS